MKEKVEIKLKSELDALLIENEKNLLSLKEVNTGLEEIESLIYNDTKLDINKLSIEIQNLKSLRQETDDWNIHRNFNAIIERSLDDLKNQDLENKMEVIHKMSGEILNQNTNSKLHCTLNILLLSKSLKKLLGANKQQLENWFIKIKFPVFDGNSINSILSDIKSNHNEKLKLFAHYFEILSELISHKHYTIGYEHDELFSSFLSKKVIYTFLQNFLKDKREEAQLDVELMELFDLVPKYMKRTFANVFNFIFYSLSNKNEDIDLDLEESATERIKLKTISLQNFFIKNTIHHINSYIETNYEQILVTFSTKPQLLIKLIKKFSDFNKILKKEYAYDVWNEPLLSDTLISINSKPRYEENIKELIKIQTSFAANFIKGHIKSKLNETIDKNEFNIDEVFELIKMIIKDNFRILICFSKNVKLFRLACETFFFNSYKDLLSLFRTSYNEEIQTFSTRKSISRNKILFILDLIIKILMYSNSLYEEVTKISDHEKLVEHFSNNMNAFVGDMNKMIENYLTIFTKELRTNGFDEMINLYTYENLTKLNEEKIEWVFAQIKKQLDGLYNNLEKVKISMESENYFMKTFLLSLISRIIEESEKSLKKIPKSKYFNLLTEKSNKVIDEMLSRFTVNEETMNVLKKPLEEIRKCFLSLNMNKI